MVTSGTVTALSGEVVDLEADTICIHGDGEHALEFAVALRRAFEERRYRSSARMKSNLGSIFGSDDLFR